MAVSTLGSVIQRNIFAPMLMLLIGACGGESPASKAAEAKTDAGDQTKTVVAAKEDKQTSKRRRAVVTLGDEKFELDRVFCVPGMQKTVIATDSRKRAGYPEVKLIDFGENEPGMPLDQAYFDFRHSEPGISWRLSDGEVEQEGDVVTASGALQGRRMLENADGTNSSAPLDGDDMKEFTAEVRCK